MGFLTDWLTDWLKELLIEGIMGNLTGLFDTVNSRVGEIAVQVGTTPAAWNAGVFSLIRQLSETVILPIAGLILTFVATYELIQLIIEKNNLHDLDYQRRTTRNKAQYSLDCDDGIEYSACLHEPTPQELLDRMELFVHLWNALNSLPEVQGVRVEAHLILGKSYRQIAREQGVDKSAVRHSVKSGKAAMRKYLKKFL